MSFLPDDAVQAILAHMNDDHGEDSLLIVRANGQPDATSARMEGFDQQAGRWTATVEGADVPVEVAWPEALTDRKSVRAQIVRLYDDALRDLGLPPREERH